MSTILYVRAMESIKKGVAKTQWHNMTNKYDITATELVEMLSDK